MKSLKLLIILIFECIIAGALYHGYDTIIGFKVYRTVQVEAGTQTISPDLFLRDKETANAYLLDISNVHTNVPTDYPLKIVINKKTYEVTLKVVDTIAPKGEPISKVIYNQEALTAADFVTNIVDASYVNVSFAETYDFSQAGDYTVKLILQDAGGNTTQLEAKATVVLDNEPPEIIGTNDLTAYIGDTVDYRSNVTVVDNHDTAIGLQVDSSDVNLKKTGTYQVIYTATDAAGNEAKQIVNVTVEEPNGETINEEVITYLAEQVLSEIVTSDMTKAQKAKAIYNWTRSNITYTNTSNQESWLYGAYQGFTKKSGDSFVCFATAKALLTAAGIDNIDVVKSGTASPRYWSLIDCGGGYYHFDAISKHGGADFFMLTDEQLEAYSSAHNNSHLFDHSLYPATPKEKATYP